MTGAGAEPGASGRPDRRDQAAPTVVPRPAARRELVVGLFVLAGIVAALTVLFALTEPATFRGRYFLYAQVDDAGGIRSGDPVQLRGVNIGRIFGFQIVSDGVLMRLEIENRYAIPEGSRARLVSNGILGGLVLVIEPGPPGTRMEDGDTIPGIRGEGVLETVERVGGEAGRVLEKVEQLLSDGAVDTLGQTMRDLQRLTASVAATAVEQGDQLRDLSRSLSRSAAGIERAVAGPELARAIARTDSATVLLGQTAASLRRSSSSLEVILARMEHGEGTLGLLSRDETLYRNLSRSFESLASLLDDIRQNPRRYVRLEIF